MAKTEKRICTTEEIVQQGRDHFPELRREEYYRLRWQLVDEWPLLITCAYCSFVSLDRDEVHKHIDKQHRKKGWHQ